MSESEGRGGHNKISRDELLRALADLRDKLGEVPRLKDWRERGAYSAKALYNEFDSWNAALDALDMEKHHVVNKERLTFECDNPACSETVEKTPGIAGQSKYHYCSQDCHYAHNSERYSGDSNPAWNSVNVDCEICGESMLRDQWDVDNKDTLLCSRECWREWWAGRWSGENHYAWKEYPELECEWCGKSYTKRPAKADGSRFCSKTCVGQWKSENWSGAGNVNWKGGHNQYMGANWPEKRVAAITRDQARCRDCGMTEAEHFC